MKLLIIHNFYKSNQVGGEDQVYQAELAALRERYGEAQVLAYSVSNDSIRPLSLFFSIFFSFSHFIRVYKIIKKEKVKITHVHNFFPLLTPACFMAAKLAGSKVVMTLHNYRPWCISGILYIKGIGQCEACVGKTLPIAGIKNRCYRGSLIQSVAAQAAFLFYRAYFYLSFVDRFFVMTESQARRVNDFGIPKTKVRIKPNFVHPPSEVLQTGHIKRNGYVYVGRIEEPKGTRLLLEAFQKLGSSFNLTLIGTGEDYTEYKRRFESHSIRFMGNLPRREVFQEIKKAKYLIQPSLVLETFGLTIIEAFSVGTPAIGFKIGTRLDFIKHGKNGWLTDPDQLIETIKMADADQAYETISAEAFESAKKFSKDQVLDQQNKEYEVLLGLRS